VLGTFLGGTLVMVLFVCWLVLLLPLIFYLIALQRALASCAVENRRMQPGLVWLQLVPLVGLVWQFFVVLAVSDSLHAEFQKRGVVEEPDPGRSLGLAMCILFACGVVPFLGVLTVLAGFVCWVLYWVRIAGLTAKLAPAAAVA
jgi:hypothetical protein